MTDITGCGFSTMNITPLLCHLSVAKDYLKNHALHFISRSTPTAACEMHTTTKIMQSTLVKTTERYSRL